MGDEDDGIPTEREEEDPMPSSGGQKVWDSQGRPVPISAPDEVEAPE